MARFGRKISINPHTDGAWYIICNRSLEPTPPTEQLDLNFVW